MSTITVSRSRLNRVLLFAILLATGPIEDSSGRVGSLLRDLINLNGGNLQSASGLNVILREYSEFIRVNRNATRTYGIELISMPTDYEEEVEEIFSRIIFEAPIEEVKEIEEEITPVEVEIVPAIMKINDADLVAASIIRIVMERFNDENVESNAWRKLRDQNVETADLKRRIEVLTSELETAKTRIANLQAENITLNSNLRASIKDTSGVVREMVQVGIDKVMREAPISSKVGNDKVYME